VRALIRYICHVVHLKATTVFPKWFPFSPSIGEGIRKFLLCSTPW